MGKKEVNIVLGHIGNVSCKGDITQFICQDYIEKGNNPLVVKYSGGPNFFNEVESDGIRKKLCYFGGGTFLGIPTLLTSECYINPISFMKEYEDNGKPLFNYQYSTKIVTPYDIAYQNMYYKDMCICHNFANMNGFEGIYATKERCERNDSSIFSRNPEAYLSSVERYYAYKNVGSHDFIDEAKSNTGEFISAMGKMLEERKRGIMVMEELYDTLVFESSYGGLLNDLNFGLKQMHVPYETGPFGLKKYFGEEYSAKITLCHNIVSFDYCNEWKNKTFYSSLERHCIDRYDCKFAFVFSFDGKIKNDDMVFRENFAKWSTNLYKQLGIFDLSFRFIEDGEGNCKYVIGEEI